MLRSSPHASPRRPVVGGAVPLLLIAGLCLAPGRFTSQKSTAPGSDGGRPAGPSRDAPATKPPPLELDADEPLLLEAPASPAAAKGKPAVDNSACLVCHVNFKKEALASSHAAHGVACSKCHGPSVAHRNDEANIIPPDVMFATEVIDGSCARCHDGHDVEPRAVIGKFLEKNPGTTDLSSLVCTRCHGEHRLSVRTVRWDRQTGKLLAGGKTLNHRGHGGHGEEKRGNQ
ncbi:MAG: cytochrome c3 family protein [Isosphaeraceae bacterium]